MTRTATGASDGPGLPGDVQTHQHIDLFVSRETALTSTIYPTRCTVGVGRDASLYFDADELQRFREFLATVAAAMADADAASRTAVPVAS